MSGMASYPLLLSVVISSCLLPHYQQYQEWMINSAPHYPHSDMMLTLAEPGGRIYLWTILQIIDEPK